MLPVLEIVRPGRTLCRAQNTDLFKGGDHGKQKPVSGNEKSRIRKGAADL